MTHNPQPTTHNSFPIHPSLLAFDFARLGEQVAALSDAGAAGFHFDLMDGAFVPNLTFGPMVPAALRSRTSLPFAAHLMVYRPEDLIAPLRDAGVNRVYLHPESTPHIHRALSLVLDAGMQAGVALNPGTPISVVEPVLPLLSGIVLMSVDPGFGGQPFQPAALPRVAALRALLDAARSTASLACDGGVDETTIGPLAAAGMSAAVVGNALFRGDGPAAALRRIADAAAAQPTPL